MKQINLYTLLLLTSIFLCQCKTNSISSDQKAMVSSDGNTSLPFLANSDLILLDSASASVAIVTDEKDHFFQRVTNTEMAIQMKENRDCPDKKTCVDGYKDFLRADVVAFTEADKANIKTVFGEIAEMINKVNVDLMKDLDVVLIKTKAKHYGESVYYTRENKIIIPYDVLSNFKKDQFKQTMLHELFHILSRYNEVTRDALYKMIGFIPVNGLIVYPEGLGSRKLLNPDGTTDYMIQIGDKLAYPLISSKQSEFSTDKPRFFDYLDFKLYELQPGEDGVYNLAGDIPFQEAGDFFKQIKDNTDYIIHPDEVMADNFIYTIYYLADNEKLKDFSKEGMALINGIGEVLKAIK